MKNLKWIILLFGILMIGCIPQQMVKQDPFIVKLKIEGVDNVKVKTDESKINKSMEIPNERISLSGYTFIEGDVGFMKLFMGFNQADAANLWQDLEALKARNIKILRIYMNSPGGSSLDGMAMANILENFRNDGGYIEAIAYGRIASAAVPIFAVCNKRMAQKDTVFMVHPSKLNKYGYFAEELKDLDSQRKMMNMVETNYVNKLAKYTKLSADKWLEKEKETTWFCTKEAVEWGLVDEIQ